MNQYYDPNNEEDYKSFQMTGNSLELKKEEVLTMTLNVINEFVRRTESGEKNVKPDPFNDSLYVDIEDKTVMIPHDLQNEAINIFMEQRNSESIKYVNNEVNESNLDENIDEDLVEEDDDEKYKNDSNQTIFYLLLLIILIAALMYIFKLY